MAPAGPAGLPGYAAAGSGKPGGGSGLVATAILLVTDQGIRFTTSVEQLTTVLTESLVSLVGICGKVKKSGLVRGAFEVEAPADADMAACAVITGLTNIHGWELKGMGFGVRSTICFHKYILQRPL